MGGGDKTRWAACVRAIFANALVSGVRKPDDRPTDDLRLPLR